MGSFKITETKKHLLTERTRLLSDLENTDELFIKTKARLTALQEEIKGINSCCVRASYYWLNLQVLIKLSSR